MFKKDAVIIATLAWRNVWKNKRRTILTLITILVGCTMIIFMNAVAKGGHDQMIEDAVAENNGHIQIHEKGFWENRSIEYAFRDDPSLAKKLAAMPEIKAFAKRIHAGGLLSYGDVTAGVMVQGVEPDKEAGITTLKKDIVKGAYLAEGDMKSVLIGETLAKNLGADVGSKIALISQGFDGSIAAEYLFVKGIFRSPSPEYDRALAIMPIRQAKETFAMEDFINSIVITVKRTDQAASVRERIIEMMHSSDIEVMGWDELMPEIVQFIVMDDFSGYIFDFILFMVVAFGVLNTIQMSVFERIREFGVMLAIGTKPSQVVWIVFAESCIISAIGVVLGIAAGALVSLYFNINPLDYSEYAKEMSVWGVNTTKYPADMTVVNGLVTGGVTFILSALFSIAPAFKASKLKPIEAIRQL